MMILSLCQTCLQKYDILVENSDVDLIKELSDETGTTCPCPRQCGGTINLVGNGLVDSIRGKQLKDSIHLTGKELYKAVHGAGLPDEFPSNDEIIRSLLLANKIESVDVEIENMNLGPKFYLHEIRLSNGVTIHLGAGRLGAEVLKITRSTNGSGNTGRSSS